MERYWHPCCRCGWCVAVERIDGEFYCDECVVPACGGTGRLGLATFDPDEVLDHLLRVAEEYPPAG